SRYRFTACILSFEENLAIKNAPPIVNYVPNNWGALHIFLVSFLSVTSSFFLFNLFRKNKIF
ncbi:hypothetical protein, partial [Brevibacillus laterosporus]|uniref:hypothetical protein n=1 Tax=Brevibacillus laterosporus TaxID=1465 RepID=UPI00215D0A6A